MIRPRPRTRRVTAWLAPAAGFTLIELLVALAIFGVVAAMSVRALVFAVDHRAQLEQDNRRWRELDRLLATLEIDLASALGAPAPFLGRREPAERGGVFLAFARAGHAHANEHPVPARAIVYRLAEGHVERSVLASPYAESAARELAASRYPASVPKLSLRYLSARGEWLSSWDDGEAELPRALEIALDLDDRSRIRRVLSVR